MAETSVEQQPAKDESVLEEAKRFLVQGKRFMALEDYQSATDHLEQAVQLYDAYHGVGKIQCADAYLEYGLALVALANLEAGSGTDKIMKKAGIEGDEDEGEDEEVEEEEGEEEEEEEEGGEDEDDKLAQEEGDANENGEKSQTQAKPGSAARDSKETNGQADNNVPVAMETNSPAKTNGTHSATNGVNARESDPTPGTSSGKTGKEADGEADEDESEATTIEIAWEVLCLAKRLFMTDESLEGRLKLAETYQKLGEISIEWDNNDNAIDILKECLKLREAILPPGDRLIALTYYNLGLAHSFKSETQEANESFQKASQVIEQRIETLSGDLDKAKAEQDTVVVSAYEKEINELKELLPDIKMRMDDSKEDQEKSTEVLKRTRDELQEEEEQVKKVLLDTSKPVDDITHLIKRKAT